MAKAIGIGGVFLHFQGEEKALFEWYETYLGLSFSEYGSGFLEGEQLVTLTFKRPNEDKHPIINFKVDDIQAIIAKFKQDGIEIVREIETYPYGLFASFMDPFGNFIELWEPDAKAYIEMAHYYMDLYQKKQSKKS